MRKTFWNLLCEVGQHTMDSYSHTGLWKYAMEYSRK